MSAYETLTAARSLIANPESWTQGVYARDEKGKQTGVWDANAVCLCSIGAIAKAANSHLANPIPHPVKSVLEKCGIKNCIDLVSFNDSHTHEQVIALFDRAIATAETQEK